MKLMKDLSIKSRLIIMMLAISVLSILVVGVVGYRSSWAALTHSIFNQLTSLRAAKTYEIESYFERIESQLRTLSESLTVIHAINDLSLAFPEIESQPFTSEQEQKLLDFYDDNFLPELEARIEGKPVADGYYPSGKIARFLQYHYVAGNPHPRGKKQLLDQAEDGTLYSQAHARYHPILRHFLEEFGYYDLFLVDGQGRVVYSVYKETDFATNLTTGPYSSSNLAEVVERLRNVRDRDVVELIDFAAYRPSLMAPAAFIGTPIFEGSKRRGTLVFQLPIDEINRIMTGDGEWRRNGLGDTGETYLAGSDRHMRSISRFLAEDPEGLFESLHLAGVPPAQIEAIRTYGTSILVQKVDTAAVSAALTGKSGTDIIADYRGVDVLSSYTPLEIAGVDWVLLSEMDAAEAFEPLSQLRKRYFLTAVSLVVLATMLAMLLAHVFSRPIHTLIVAARQVAKGRTDVEIDLTSPDELAELATSFNGTVATLRQQAETIAKREREHEELLCSVLPRDIVQRRQRGDTRIADNLTSVSVLFSRLVGLDIVSATRSESETVAVFSGLIDAFDRVADRLGIDRMRTTGGTYMAVCGATQPFVDHSKRLIEFALEQMRLASTFNLEHQTTIELKIAIHSGPAMAGVIGRDRVAYDVWGETVDVAGRLAAASCPGTVQVTGPVYEATRDAFDYQEGGALDGQDKPLETWTLRVAGRS